MDGKTPAAGTMAIGVSYARDTARAVARVLYERRWKVASVVAVYALGRACEIAPPGIAAFLCELLARVAKVLP